MPSTLISRRVLAFHMAAIPLGISSAARVFAAGGTEAAAPAKSDGLSQSSEAIHQEIVFNASPRRVYQALTDAKEFDAVTRLSDAVDLLAAPGAKPTSISHDAGGPFTLFGGYITGRNLEILRDERLVQAWRAARWQLGDYSIVRFALSESGPATRLVLDHRGFPEGQGASLAYGWRVHYWEPLAKFLSHG